MSESNYGNNFYLIINGTNSDVFNVYCNISNTCYIRCQSSDSCTNLKFYCYEIGTCFVDCDISNGINCPYYGVYGEWM